MIRVKRIVDGDKEEFKRLFIWAAEGSNPEPHIVCSQGNVTNKESGYYFMFLDDPSCASLIPEKYRERVISYMPKHVSWCPACTERYVIMEQQNVDLRRRAGIEDTVQ